MNITKDQAIKILSAACIIVSIATITLSAVVISHSRYDTGDINRDHKVDGLDLSIVLTQWSERGTPYNKADINQDGVVDALDLSILSSNWTKK